MFYFARANKSFTLKILSFLLNIFTLSLSIILPAAGPGTVTGELSSYFYV